MAHPVEPMDIDCIDSDFDNKENTFHHHNVQPCTEKGYEELDVSELNMRLRYSVTPAGSPMSKSFTSYVDNKTLDSEDSLNTTVNEVNLTRSLNATMTKNDSVVKSLKNLPLQSLPNDQSMDRSVSVLRPLDSTITTEKNNLTVTVSGTNDIDENLSLLSSSSSDVQTPEATTPTKDIPKNDGGSPIMRGLKSVLNMFRSSQSPIPPPENESTTPKQLTPTPSKRLSSEPRDKVETKPVLASTPIAAHREREGSGSKRNSPLKDSIIFNDDLEKELQWKDETTILFSEEKIPIHKLFPQKKNKVENKPSGIKTEMKPNLDTTVEYMDISCNDSLLNDKTMTELSPETNKNEFHVANESDSEFLDCENESNVTKTESYAVDNKAEEFIKVLSSTQNIMNDVTINANEQEIVQKMHETERKVLDVPVPSGIDNMQGNVNNNVFTSSLINETTDTNKSTCEKNQNQTRLIENILQQSNLEISGIDCDLNNDVTVTLDCQENKGKYLNNMLEVSTLESHTQSLSSLIESLDATKTIDQENKSLSNNNSLVIATQDQLIQVAHIEKQNPDLTITIQDQEINIPEVNNTGESLNLPENTEFAAKDPNATIDILEQEEDIEVKSDTVENKVVDTTINITYENKEDVPVSIAQPEPSMPALNEPRDVDKVLIAATEPSMSLNESPADIPLPNDEDIDKDIINPRETSAAVTKNPHLPIFDRSMTEKEVNGILKNAEDAVSELICNVELLPDMILDTKDLNIDKEISIPIQLEVQPEKEEIRDSNKMLCEVSNDPESEVKKDVSLGDIENVNITFDMQTPNINESVNNVPNLPDILNQEEVQDVEMMALDTSAVHTADSDVNESIIMKRDANKSENNENNPSIPNNTQEGSERNDDQSNIDSTILPDNQMASLVLACEEILDKNREISEVILTEPQIHKVQHESDLMLIGHEVKDATSQMSQNTDHLIPANDLNNTFKKGEQLVEQQVEVNNTIIQLETEDSNKTVTTNDNTVQDNIELKITQKEEITSLPKSLADNKENEDKIYEDINTKYAIGLDVTQKEEIDKVEKSDIIDTTNKTVTIDHDVHLKEGHQNDSVKENQEEALRNIEQDKTIGNETFSKDTSTKDVESEKRQLVIAEDEIIVSENNSPYVSVAADLDKLSEEKPLDNFEEIENPFATKSNVPSSPPITSKGYNFNFDDIDDPFATKVKIRMSPAPETPNKAIEIKTEEKKMPKTETSKKDANKNRRRSQPARHKLSNTKKPFNKTFDVSESVPDSEYRKSKEDIKTRDNEKDAKVEEQQNMSVDFSNETKCDVITLDVNKNDHATPIEAPQAGNIDVVDVNITKNATMTEQISADVTMSEENKDSIESIPSKSNDIKTTSSSEQSTYYSAGTSSTDSTKSRNVFNLPEIDDMNFNPFATKTKIRQSPPRDVGMENPFATKSKIMNSPDSSVIIQGDQEEKTNSSTNTEKHIEDKMETEPMEKDSSANISNITSSSKGTDKDDTIREVNTEDEDTIEGPFIEAEYVNEEQQSDFDGENIDMMQFNDLPAQEQDENAEGELFIDAEAFEFLLNQNKSNVVADSGKESLFLKFDPLFAKRMSSDSVVAALSRAKKRQSTPTRTPKQQRNASVSVAGPSKMSLNYETDLNVTEAVEDLNTTVTKPMMVVTPAVNPNAALRKSVTPTRTNRRSITFTSPAMAVIDRLLSLSANSSLVEQETTIPQASREQNEAQLALTQLREVLAEKEIHVYNLRSESKELKDRLSSLESQMKVLEAEGQQRLKKINDLNDKLAEKTKMNKSMAVVVEEYERTIASLIAETEADKKRHAAERIALMNERDEQTAHLASMEVSFNDLHSKYEKSKQVIMNYKANEETYKQSLREFEENVTKMQKNYELLKQHATSKLNHANDELQKINRAHEAEVLKLNAMIKRKELHITSLEETLAQKTKANEELTAICDELINKVG